MLYRYINFIPGISHFNFQIRTAYLVENAAGYPLTKSSITNNPKTNIPTNSLTVFNDTLSSEIVPTNGWYLIPPGASVRIEKIVLMPALIHYNDLDVADPNFSSYTERRLDKSTTWNIDTGITITRVVDPGDPTQIDNQTPTVQSIGDGIKTYTIGR